MYNKKTIISHNLSLFIINDDLIALATALNAGDQLLQENNAFELKAKLLHSPLIAQNSDLSPFTTQK